MYITIEKDGQILETVSRNYLISLKTSQNSSSDNLISLGIASASTVNFSFRDINESIEYRQDLEGSIIKVYNDDDDLLGVYNFTTRTADENDVVNMSGNDNIIKLDTRYDNSFTFPLTVSELLENTADFCGLSIGTAPTVNMNLEITDGTFFLNKYCRDLIKSICMITGTFAYIDSNGDLSFKWYETSPEITLNYGQLQNISLDRKTINLDGFNVVLYDSAFNYGSNDKLNITNEDGLMKALGYDDLVSALQNVADAIPVTYYKATFTMRYNKDISLGDMITVVDKKNNSYNILVCNISTDYIGMTISSYGTLNSSNSYVVESESATERTTDIVKGNVTNGMTNSYRVVYVNNTSRCLLNLGISDTALTGTITIKREVDGQSETLKTLTKSAGVFNYSLYIDLDDSYTDNSIVIETDFNVSSSVMDISFVIINCQIEEMPSQDYVVITRENTHSTLLLNIVEIQEQNAGGGGYVE